MEFIAYGTKMKHGNGEFCSRVSHPWYFFSCFLTDYVIEIDSRLVEGRRGDVVVFEPHSVIYHGPRADSEEGFVNDWIYVGGDDVYELLRKYPIPIGEPFNVGSDFHLRHAIETIEREMLYMKRGAEEKCEMALKDAVIDIHRAYTADDGLASIARIENASEIVMSDYKRQWRLSDMAALAGYSESRFSALYKQRYGKSPIDDLIERRIEQAKQLMIYSGMNVGEIAEAVGFSSIYYFSKNFKKRVGVSPREYADKEHGLK